MNLLAATGRSGFNVFSYHLNLRRRRALFDGVEGDEIKGMYELCRIKLY